MAILLLAFTSHDTRADCPAAPLADPDDMVVSFLALNGTQAAPGTLMPSTVKEGMLVYDDTADKLKICDGTNWVDVGSGSGTDTLASLSCASGEIAKYNGTVWACAADGGGGGGTATAPGFLVHKNGTNQTVTATTYQKLTWSTEVFDIGDDFASSRFTPTVAGRYVFSLNVYCIDTPSYCHPVIYKNGAQVAGNVGANSSNQGVGTSTIVDMNGTTDYVEAYVYNYGTTINGNTWWTNFSGSLVGGGSDTLTGLSCATNEIPKWSGTAWACAADGGGSGGGGTEYSASITRGSNQSVANATWTLLTWTAEAFDNGGMADIGTSASRITVPTGGAGRYVVTAQAGYAANASNGRWIQLNKNGVGSGTSHYCNTPASSSLGGAQGLGCSWIVSLAANDYLELYTYQNSGGALDVQSGFLSAARLSASGGSDTLSGLSCATNEIPKWNGTAWACAADGGGGGTGSVFHVTSTSTQALTSGWTNKINWTAETFDTGDEFDLTTDRFTPQSPGKYLLTASARAASNNSFSAIGIYKNGAILHYVLNSDAGNDAASVTAVVEANGTTDYFEAYFYVQSVGGTLHGSAGPVHFSGFKIGGGSDTLSGLSCTSGEIPKWNGTAWACAADGGGPGTAGPSFSVHRNGANQTVSTNSWTKITWPTERFDTNSNFTSDRFTPTVAGKYVFSLSAHCTNSTSWCDSAIYKNGAIYEYTQSAGTNINAPLVSIVDMNGTTDYVEAFVYNGGGTTLSGGPLETKFSGGLLGGGGSFDTLSGLSCTSGEIPKWNGSAWACAADGGGSGGSSSVRSATFGYRSGSIAILASQGITSIVRTAAGTYRVTWTTPFADDDYLVFGSCNAWGSGGAVFTLEGNSGGASSNVAQLTTRVDVGCRTGTNTNTDVETVSLVAVPVNGFGGGGTDTLTGLSCSTNEIPKWNGSAWACAADGGGSAGTSVAFRAHKNGTDQTVTASTETPLTWSAESFDTNNNFNTGTGRFTPTVAGKYLITAAVYCSNGTFCDVYLYKNSTRFAASRTHSSGANFAEVTGMVDMNGSTDYVEVRAYNSAGTTINGIESNTFVAGHLIGGGGSDTLSGLSCSSGQIPKWNGSAWACGVDDGASTATSPAFSVHNNTVNFTVTTSTAAPLVFSTKRYDTTNNYSTTTGRFTPNVAGKYLFIARAYCTDNANWCQSRIYKNGAHYSETGDFAGGVQQPLNAAVIDMNGTSDYVQMHVYNGGGTTVGGAPGNTSFEGSLLGGSGGGGATPAGTVAGAMQFRGSTAVLAADDVNLVWDDTNNRLGIGTPTPTAKLHVVGGFQLGSTLSKATLNNYDGDSTTSFNISGAASSDTRLLSIHASTSGTQGSALSGQIVGIYGHNGTSFVDALSVNNSGAVGIGTSTPTASAQLQLNSTTRGFLPPRMTTAQRDAIASPATGLTIYNTTTGGLDFYNGTSWQNASSTVAFLARASSTVLTNASFVPVVFNTQIRDDGGDNYNPATGTFTAPSDGWYHFSASVYTGIPAAAAGAHMILSGSAGRACFQGQTSGGSVYATPSCSGSIYLTAGQTMQATVMQSTGGSVTLDNSVVNHYFSGFKLAGGGSGGGGSSQWTTAGSDIYYNTGKVGIGTATIPSPAKVNVYGGYLQLGNASGASNDVAVNFMTLGGDTTMIGQGGAKGWTMTARTDGWSAAAAQNDVGLYYWNGSGWTTGFTVDSVTGALGVGVIAADASARLQVDSTTQGFLPPRMTTAQRDAIASPAEGLVVYNTTTKSLDLRVASSWLSSGGSMSGNTMVSGWPDAIRCLMSSPSNTNIILINAVRDNVGGGVTYVFNQGSTRFQLAFTSAGAYSSSDFWNGSSWGSFTSDCGSQSIAQNYTAGRAFNFVGGGTATADGSAGQVQFNEGGNLKADAALHWDNVNKRLGIGAVAPSALLHLSTSAPRIILTDTDTGANNWIDANSGAGILSFSADRDNTVAGSALGFSVDGSEAMRIMAGGNVGIGTTTPSSALDISSGTLSLLVGADNTAFTRTNSTQKAGRIAVPHYLSAQVPALALMGVSDSTDNNIFIGGGSGLANAATTLSFYTAPDNTTLTGTRRMFIDASGNVGIGTTTPETKLHIEGGPLTLKTDTKLWRIGENIDGANPGIFGLRNQTDGVNALSVLANGNVGIGTTAPQSTLEVFGTGTVMATPTNLALYNLRLRANGPNGSTSSGIHFGEGTVGGAAIIGYDDGISAKQGLRLYGFDGTNMPLGMVIDSNGNVGIGTTSPTYKMQVAGGGTNGLYIQDTAGTTRGIIIGGQGGLGTVNYTGGPGDEYRLYNTANGHLTLGTNNAERVRIAASGNVGIGTTAPNGKVHVVGNMIVGPANVSSYGDTTHGGIGMQGDGLGGRLFITSNTSYIQEFNWQPTGTRVGSITISAGGTTFSTTSDRRVKENVGETGHGLDTLMRIPVKDFNFIADKDKKRVQGFIAQELYKIYPEAVTTNGDDGEAALSDGKGWAVDYGRITPLLVKSIQELKAENDNLRAELKAANDNDAEAIEELRREINALKAAQ